MNVQQLRWALRDFDDDAPVMLPVTDPEHDVLEVEDILVRDVLMAGEDGEVETVTALVLVPREEE